ncbi:MAG TPA: LLM class flavin-dependent oxidoreductase [Acidimicrobiales bacterium]|nr:LLM class flavin-dependent oxidoreductase [Acidimicrobiales bacterium]
MQVGLALPQFDFSVPGRSPLPFDDVLGWARTAERVGLDSVWLADHLFWSIDKYGAPPGTHSALDPIAALAGVARATERVALGTMVLCAPLRPALVAAKALETLDVVAGGRLRVGVGAGWYEPEFHAAGIPFRPPAERLRQLAATVETYKARFGGRTPVFVGGRGDRLLDVVARCADGWNTVWAFTPEEYRARLAVLDRACERVGRDPASVERSIGLYTLVGEDEADLARRFERLREATPPGVLDVVALDDWRRGRLVGTVEQVREQLGAWAELGVAAVVCCVGALPFAVTDVEQLELVGAARQGLR